MSKSKKFIYYAGWYLAECLLLLMPSLAIYMIPGITGRFMALGTVLIMSGINLYLRLKYRSYKHIKAISTAFLVANVLQILMFGDFLYTTL